MSEFMNGLFADTSKETGVNFENDDNNYIINESVILEMLGGDTEKLKTVFESVGKFGVRDGILAEDASIDCCTAAFNNIPCPDAVSILAIAKESGSKDYELYTKAIMLMKQCMCNMRAMYGDIAKKRLDVQRAEVMANPRIMSSIEACCQNKN